MEIHLITIRKRKKRKLYDERLEFYGVPPCKHTNSLGLSIKAKKTCKKKNNTITSRLLAGSSGGVCVRVRR